MSTERSPRGVLRKGAVEGRFTLERYPPCSELVEIVEWYWSVSWNLPDGTEHEVELLNHPSYQLVVERGESGVFPMVKGKATKLLRGQGRAFGAKFWPGAFHAVWKRDVPAADSERIPLEMAFGEPGAAYERTSLSSANDEERIAAADSFLVTLAPDLTPDATRARRIVESIATGRDIVQVSQVAETHGLSVRALQRLFDRCVGVTPKWVVQRYRIHEAVEALEAGTPVDLAALAARLNYYDQAHFSRDFTQLVGRSPSQYVRDLDR